MRHDQLPNNRNNERGTRQDRIEQRNRRGEGLGFCATFKTDPSENGAEQCARPRDDSADTDNERNYRALSGPGSPILRHDEPDSESRDGDRQRQ